MTIDIRELHPDDRNGWDQLWADYLRFYRQPNSPEIADSTFTRLCAQEHGFFGFVAAQRDGALLGLAHCVLHGTTWSATPSCYLNDLYVAPEGRGANLARRLIEAAGERAHERGSHLMYWNTQQFNGPARSLYDRVGELQSYVRYNRRLASGDLSVT